LGIVNRRIYFFSIVVWLLFEQCQNTPNKEIYFKPSFKELINSSSGDAGFEEFYNSSTRIYSNYRYGFAFKWPSGCTIDRGFSEHTIIRGVQEDSAISFSINVFEIKVAS